MGDNIVVMVCQSQKTQNHESAGKLNYYNGIPNQAFVPGLVCLPTLYLSNIIYIVYFQVSTNYKTSHITI